jgi:hypothetical protein
VDRIRQVEIVPFLAAAVSLAVPCLVYGDPTFTNVTQQAGVQYIQGDQEPASSQDSMGYTGGAAVGDYDKDGWDDLYVTRLTGPDILFRNLGNGTFEDVTTTAHLDWDIRTNGAGWADVDNDGDLDLYVTGHGTLRHYLFINRGDGTFSEEAISRGASIESNDKHTGFSMAFGDYNLDGWLDIHTTEWTQDDSQPSHSRLLRNRGPSKPGFFEDVTVAAGVWPSRRNNSFGSTFTDLDRDGWPDLAITADFRTSELWWNNGDGTFVAGLTEQSGLVSSGSDMGSTFGDYDNDGDLDWFITAININNMFRNEGGRVFTEVTGDLGVSLGGWGWGAAFFDFDNDGDLDLTMTNGMAYGALRTVDQSRLWRNDGAAVQMTQIEDEAGIDDTDEGRGLLVFDFDHDGDLDMFIANNRSSPILYRNDGGNINHWLRIRFQSRHENSEGLGVKIWLRDLPGGRLQYRELGVSTHFLGQSERVAHFGLGPSLPESLEVTLEAPGGFRNTLSDVGADAMIVLDAADFDGDGLSNRAEGSGDVDEDGTANYLDHDSDGDGFWDRVEVAHNGHPFDAAIHPPPSPVAGDVNFDGEPNAVDVQIAVNRALGLDPGYRTDLNDDTEEDAVDVQIVIVSVLATI